MRSTSAYETEVVLIAFGPDARARIGAILEQQPKKTMMMQNFMLHRIGGTESARWRTETPQT